MYLVFAGEIYYPCGGMDDLVGSFDSIEAAREAGKRNDWYQIVRIVRDGLELVEEGKG